MALIEELDCAWRSRGRRGSVEFGEVLPRMAQHHVAEKVLLRVINLIRF